jgi:hypothetical protein
MPRQTSCDFLFPAIPTPFWFVKAESRNTLLLATGKDERLATLITGYGFFFHFALQQRGWIPHPLFPPFPAGSQTIRLIIQSRWIPIDAWVAFFYV